MALFVISYIDKPGSLALRLATREAHLAYAHSKEAPAKVRLGGPYLDGKGGIERVVDRGGSGEPRGGGRLRRQRSLCESGPLPKRRHPPVPDHRQRHGWA